MSTRQITPIYLSPKVLIYLLHPEQWSRKSFFLPFYAITGCKTMRRENGGCVLVSTRGPAARALPAKDHSAILPLYDAIKVKWGKLWEYAKRSDVLGWQCATKNEVAQTCLRMFGGLAPVERGTQFSYLVLLSYRCDQPKMKVDALHVCYPCCSNRIQTSSASTFELSLSLSPAEVGNHFQKF